jgi:hypothetical protein
MSERFNPYGLRPFVSTVRVPAEVPSMGDRYYRVMLSLGQAKRHNNGCLVSIGLTVGRDLTRSTFLRWKRAGQTREITYTEWNL